MRQSTIELLKRISTFSKAAAKLSLDSGPDRPYDPNFGVIEGPQQGFTPVQNDDEFQGSKLAPKPRESGVYPKEDNQTSLVQKISKRLISDLDTLFEQVKRWAINTRNVNSKKYVAHYRHALLTFQSMAHMADDVYATSFLDRSSKKYKDALAKQLTALDEAIRYLDDYGELFYGLSAYKMVYAGVYHLKDFLVLANGSIPEADKSAYDMFAEEDAMEDAGALQPMSHESMMKDEPLSGPATQQLPVNIQKIPDSDPSLSFEVEPIKF